MKAERQCLGIHFNWYTRRKTNVESTTLVCIARKIVLFIFYSMSQKHEGFDHIRWSDKLYIISISKYLLLLVQDYIDDIGWYHNQCNQDVEEATG